MLIVIAFLIPLGLRGMRTLIALHHGRNTKYESVDREPLVAARWREYNWNGMRIHRLLPFLRKLKSVYRPARFLSFLRYEATGEIQKESRLQSCLRIGTLSKPRRRRQQGHGKIKDLIGETIAQHVRFKT